MGKDSNSLQIINTLKHGHAQIKSNHIIKAIKSSERNQPQPRKLEVQCSYDGMILHLPHKPIFPTLVHTRHKLKLKMKHGFDEFIAHNFLQFGVVKPVFLHSLLPNASLSNQTLPSHQTPQISHRTAYRQHE